MHKKIAQEDFGIGCWNVFQLSYFSDGRTKSFPDVNVIGGFLVVFLCFNEVLDCCHFFVFGVVKLTSVSIIKLTVAMKAVLSESIQLFHPFSMFTFHVVFYCNKLFLAVKLGVVRTRAPDGKLRTAEACIISQSDSSI